MLAHAEPRVAVPVNETRHLARPAPRTLAEAELPFQFVMELVAKVLFQRGHLNLTQLSTHVKLPSGLIEPILQFMRSEMLCELGRRGGGATDAEVSYSLTANGTVRAAECLARNGYVGPAPVSIADYCSQVDAQSVAEMRVVRDDVTEAFAGVMADPLVLTQLGTAMNSGRAIYIYGPPGSGKTYLAERLARLLHGEILVPHAILVDGEVIQIFDPAAHHAAVADTPAAPGIDRRQILDQRWIRCARPTILTGGELTIDMLDLQFDQSARYYQAPPHLKANNGLFIIDDLGRQRCTPEELMNRWIVPLDRRVDFLALHTGHKFKVPFDVVVVFSSNFAPEKLADESFLRRLGYKVNVGAQTISSYETIFRDECQRNGVGFCADAFAYLMQEKHRKEQRALLACYPKALIAQIRDLACFENTKAQLNQRVIDWAWNNYFAGR